MLSIGARDNPFHFTGWLFTERALYARHRSPAADYARMKRNCREQAITQVSQKKTDLISG